MKAAKLAYPYLCGLLAENPTSLSCAMHNAGFFALNLSFYYSVIDTKDTQSALNAMRALGIKGFSLTIPHKEKALCFVDTISDAAKKIGAINTVINDGKILFGENTDWLGILKALDEKQIDLSERRILILGAGGAARAAIYAFKERNVKWIGVANRTNQRSKDLAEEFGVSVILYEDLANLKNLSIDMFVQSTPLGSVLAEANYPFSIDNWAKEITVFDMVTRQTPLIESASKNGAVTIQGARMLFYQALEQFRLFTGCTPPADAMQSALTKELYRTEKLS